MAALRHTSAFPRLASSLAAGGAVLWASAVLAQSFTGLGFPTGATSSAARGMSADGSVVVGDSGPAFAGFGFRWTRSGGMQGLGLLPDGTYTFVSGGGVSGNGLVISGYGDTTGGQQRAYRWTSAGGYENLGVLSGGTQSLGGPLSFDGSVIACISGSAGGYRAVRWTAAGGMEDLHTLPGGAISLAYSVSADGSVIVGDGYSPIGDVAFRWTRATGMVNLGTLPGGTFSYAYAVSADGQVVVGDSDSTGGLDVAYRWTAATGMQPLGTLPIAFDYMVSNAVSADGSVVVGSTSAFFPDGNGHAWIWTSTLGLVDLNTYLPSLGIDLTGWTLNDGGAVSADGRFIAGTGSHNGVDEAWLADLRVCRADFNGGGLTVQDIFDFLNAWFAGLPSADFNGGGLTVQDIFDFLNAWFAGC